MSICNFHLFSSVMKDGHTIDKTSVNWKATWRKKISISFISVYNIRFLSLPLYFSVYDLNILQPFFIIITCIFTVQFLFSVEVDCLKMFAPGQFGMLAHPTNFNAKTCIPHACIPHKSIIADFLKFPLALK